MVCRTLDQALKLARSNAAFSRLLHVIFVDKRDRLRCESMGEANDPTEYRPCTVVYPDGTTVGIV